MTDAKLIEYCAAHCKTPKALFAAWRVNRMIALAGCPKAFPEVLDGTFHTMRDEMLRLVDLARIRMALPKDGLNIKAGRAYRGVDADVRHVIEVPPHLQGFGVVWDCVRVPAAGYFSNENVAARKDRPHGYMRLSEFKAWAIEELAS